MAFSLFFWKKKADPASLKAPLDPKEPVQAMHDDAVHAPMPFVRDQPSTTHPRLARMAEMLQQLPQPPTASAHIPPTDHHLASPPIIPAQPAAPITPPSITPAPTTPVHAPETTPHEWQAPLVQELPVEPQRPHPIIHENLSLDDRSALEILTAPMPTLANTTPTAGYAQAPVEVRPVLDPDFDERAANAFYARDGSAFWTVGEFGDALVSMSDEAFYHHVSDAHNDFASWIEGCFTGDTKTFGTMLRGLDRSAMIKLIVKFRSGGHLGDRIVAHFDDKAPAAWEFKPETTSTGSSRVTELLDALRTAELQASHDIGAAREAFITVRTRVWSELTDDERKDVLPKMREVYDHLRARG